MYDIFYLGNNQKLVTKFPAAKRVDSIQQAQHLSLTKLFWFVWNDVTPADDFLFDIYFSVDNTYDNKINHVFLHDNNGEILKNSIWLLSKTIPISKDEIDYRYVLNAKEWDIVASSPTLYDKFIINNYADYLNAVNYTTTEMFWGIPSDIIIIDQSIFNLTYTVKNSVDTFHEFDRNINHVFKNGEYYDGVVLCSKHAPISEREFKYRFITNKKEHDEVVSNVLEYDKIIVNTYEEFCELRTKVSTDFFYVIPNDVDVDWDFKYHIPYHERDTIHVFKNGDYYDGIFLIHKDNDISRREFDYRFFRNKKEIDIKVSNVKPYDRIYVDDYNDFIIQLTTINSNFVWVVPNDVDVDWDFNYHIPYYEKDNVHIFKNGKYHDGVFLIHKDKPLAQREYDYRFFVNKKEIDITVSTPASYDIVFISYNEPNADDNYARILERFPNTKRIHGVKGIHQAHIEAAQLCNTDMFWVVDGDAIILDDFNFSYQVPKWQRDQVFVWQSQNPINDLVYGYGGVKLFPKKETINMDVNSTDMTTSISSKFNAVNQLSNITAFNTSEFETWKSAFRECAKLSSKVIDRQNTDETEHRLEIWCTVGANRLYGEYAISGANAGKEFGISKNAELNLINNFDWLRKQFNK